MERILGNEAVTGYEAVVKRDRCWLSGRDGGGRKKLPISPLLLKTIFLQV